MSTLLSYTVSRTQTSSVRLISDNRSTSVSEEGGNGEGVSSEDLSLLSYTLKYKIHQSDGRRHTMTGWVVITDGPVYIPYVKV